MARRWAWWTAGSLVVVLLTLGAWRLSREIPERLRKAEEAIREEAARYGLHVSYRNVKFDILYLKVSLDNVEVRDALADLPLGRAEAVDVSLSPGRLLSGDSPVSRIRVRNFILQAEEANRPVFDKLRAVQRSGTSPEILLLDGYIRLGPMGPLKRWEAKILELRIRDVRFLGTRISLQAEKISGEVDLRGAGSGNWPFRTMEANLFLDEGVLRVRKFVTSGPSASVKASGNLDTRRRSGHMKVSGSVDLSRWISEGAPGGPWMGRFTEGGGVDFSFVLDGTPEDPGGTGKLVVHDGRFRGGVHAEADLSASLAKGMIRLEHLKGKLLGGALAGSGSYDMGSGRGEGKLSLTQASFGGVIGKEWGGPWRPAGTGDAEVAFTAGAEGLRAALSWKNPMGVERVGMNGSIVKTVRLPLAASLAGVLARGGEVTVTGFRFRAGAAEMSGKGEISLHRRQGRLEGDLVVPRGRTADYGWDFPLSWGKLAGTWKASGAAGSPQVAMRMEAQALTVAALPPFPVVLKMEGNLSDAVSFVADIPAAAMKATASGTVTGPLSGRPFLLEATVAGRDIDVSEGHRWTTAAFASFGKAVPLANRYLSGLSGMGTGDFQVSLGREAYSITGSLRSGELRLKGIGVREVSMEGRWSRSGRGERWEAQAAGKAEEGTIRLSGEGEDGGAEISGAVEGIELAKLVPLFVRANGRRVRGAASLDFSAKSGPKGWEFDRLSASVPRLAIDNTTWEGVTAKGTLGPEAGHFDLLAQSPRMRVSADVRRGGDWPLTFEFSAVDVPTAFLLAAAGRPQPVSGGTWNIEAGGTVRAAVLSEGKSPFAEAIAALRFSALASNPSVSGLRFEEWKATGKKEGDRIYGEISSRVPDTRLELSVMLREPYGFRIAGPFAFQSAIGERGREEAKTRLILSGRADISGSLGAMEKTAGSLRINQIAYRDGGIELSGNEILAQLSPEGIRWADGTLLAAGNPVRVAGKASWKGDLDIRLEGKFPAAGLRLVTKVFDRLDGMMRLDVRLTGPWNDPTVVGSGHLEGGIFSFRGYAQLFEDMKADAIISREKIIFEHFEGRSGGGYLDGRGELPLRFDDHQRLFFTADFFDMRFPYPDDLRPVLQGHAELLGPFDDFLVTGEVEIQSARYTKVVSLQKALVDFRKRLADVTARREKSDFRVRLDIDAIADGTIQIKNNLAEASAKGEFKVVGDASRVIVLGSFDVIDGFVEYQGNRYDLKRVSVDFQDPRKNNPRLDARAETKKGNVTVIVSVTGTLDKYEVDFTSDPPLSKNDIVSLLSLGVTSQALVGAEGTVGAAAASTLVLGPYKGRVEEGIRGIVSLDKFAIEPAYSTSTKTFEPKFIVGKSFGDRISVSVSTSVGTSKDSSATAEFKVLENVFLQGNWESTTTTREGDLGADVKFRYRYRQLRDFLGGRD